MVEVLCCGFTVSFHYLPPVLIELLKYPSYASGSAKAQAFQGEVDGMKGTLEVVDHLDPGYCSWLFLVQKVSRDQLGEFERLHYP